MVDRVRVWQASMGFKDFFFIAGPVPDHPPDERQSEKPTMEEGVLDGLDWTGRTALDREMLTNAVA